MANVLKYDPNVYIPHITMAREFILPDVDTSTKKGKAAADRLLRQEYSRLRAIAVKRLERLSRSEFKNDMAYQRYKDRFLKLEEMKKHTSKGDVYDYGKISKALSDVASFLSLKTSTITGAQARQRAVLEGLEKHGVKGVNAGNLREFGQFMDMLRSKLLDRIYDSERAYKVYTQARQLGMKWHGDLEKEFDYFYRNYKDMDKLHSMTDYEKKKIRAKTGKKRIKSSEYYREQLEEWKLGKREVKNA